MLIVSLLRDPHMDIHSINRLMYINLKENQN